MDAGELARACADAMWSDDAASRGLGMQLISVEPGRAVLAMTVTEKMVNGHNICHGGYIFTLADSAFAFACNTYNQRTVAQHCAVTFLNSARLNDRLIARAVERQRMGRSGIYDITVTREDGFPIAEFRGHSRTIEGELIPGATARAPAGAKA
jgi:acyl-CoA thioesterase